jgi:hypothetical protein
MSANSCKIKRLQDADEKLQSWLIGHTKSDVARHLGVSRQCIGEWTLRGFGGNVARRILAAGKIGGGR